MENLIVMGVRSSDFSRFFPAPDDQSRHYEPKFPSTMKIKRGGWHGNPIVEESTMRAFPRGLQQLVVPLEFPDQPYLQARGTKLRSISVPAASQALQHIFNRGGERSS